MNQSYHHDYRAVVWHSLANYRLIRDEYLDNVGMQFCDRVKALFRVRRTRDDYDSLGGDSEQTPYWPLTETTIGALPREKSNNAGCCTLVVRFDSSRT